MIERGGRAGGSFRGFGQGKGRCFGLIAPAALRIAAVLALAAIAGADEIELVSGRRYQGRVVERTASAVTFEVVFATGGSARIDFPANQVKSLTIDGKIPTVQSPPSTRPQTRPATKPAIEAPPAEATPTKPARTPAQVQALIQQAGKTPPEWWDAASVDYPDTLDLAGTNPAQGWQPQRNLGAYFMSVVYPNPGKWKGAIKLLHQVLTVREKDPPRLREAMDMLARSYQTFTQDWARAAFWWEKALAVEGNPSLGSVVGLADCYFRLGSKPMAVALLSKYGLDRRGAVPVVKVWAEIGELEKAVQLAEELAKRAPEDGLLAAGNACRHAGKYLEALAFYNKVLSLPGGEPNSRNRQRARASIEAIGLLERFDLAGVPDGTYAGSGNGYRGPVNVSVEVKAGRIVSVRVTEHRDDMAYTAPTEIPRQIVEKQDPRRVDAVTGATVTSEAIVCGVAKALGSARR